MVEPIQVSDPVPTPQARQQATLLLLQMIRPCVEQLSALTTALTHAFSEFDSRMAALARAESMGATELADPLPDLREHLRERRFTDQEEYVYIVEPYVRSVRNGSREWTIRTLAQYLQCNRSVVHRALLRYRKGPGRAVWEREVAPKLMQYSRVGSPTPSKPTRAAIREARAAAARFRERRDLAESAPKRSLEDLAFDDAALYGDQTGDQP